MVKINYIRSAKHILLTIGVFVLLVAGSGGRPESPSAAIEPILAQPVSLPAADTNTEIKSRESHYVDQVAVLIYHNFRLQKDDTAISEEEFDAQLKTLRERNFHVISMEQFLAFKLGEGSVPSNAVLLTFDDGYKDFYTKACPILSKYDEPATNFVIVQSSDVYNPKAFPHMTWDQMRELKRHRYSFYSHTYNSHYLVDSVNHSKPALTNRLYIKDKKREETNDEYEQRIYDDFTQAHVRLTEELGDQSNVLALPYGAYNDTVLRVGVTAGVKLFFTGEPGLAVRGGNLVPRITAGFAGKSGEDVVNEILKYVYY